MSAIKLERWLKRALLPKLRTRLEALWFEQQFVEDYDLALTIDSHVDFQMPSETPGLQQKEEEIVWPLEDEEYLTWDVASPDYSTLRQFRDIRGYNDAVETGLQVPYDNEGLAQPPRQVTM